MLIDEQIIKDLTKISDEFKRKLLAIIKQGNKLDRIELAKLVAEIDFWKDLDLETQTRLKLTELFDKYDDQINNLMKLADVQKVRDAVSVNKDILETLKYFRGEELLGRAKVFSDQLKNTLLSSIINGKTFNQVKEDLANIPLTSPQLNTVISTGYNDYGRNLLALTYEKYPEQRFLYYGTIIPTSSKQCTWLLMNQRIINEGTPNIEKFTWDKKIYYITTDKIANINSTPNVLRTIAATEFGAWEDDGRPSEKYHPYNFFKKSGGMLKIPLQKDYLKLLISSLNNAYDVESEYAPKNTLKAIGDLRSKLINLLDDEGELKKEQINFTGYTMAEINAGINTPFGVINWNGRIPNFNCDDMWLPVTETLIKSIKAFQERNKLLAEKVLGGK